MRLHRLRVQAFGPYAELQEVDFDQLNDAGVFLLTGPTGAGKTSVLDAVCFALYGVVPGDREVRSLRSAHAPAQTPTRVEVELTLGERRLRVERWPQWERPKRRGTGTTTEPAGARLVEVAPDGTETLVSSRAQEVGHELGPLLAMTSEQFMQVVLLPQGGFASFLKATSEQRRDLLEQLFATQRFAHIEGWVHDRATRLRARSHEQRSEVHQVLATLAHRAERAAPEDVDEPSLAAWRDQVLTDAEQGLADRARAEQLAQEELSHAREAEQAISRALDVARRRDDALRDLRALADSETEAQEWADRLSAHRRAAVVGSLVQTLEEAESRAELARVAAEVATEQLGDGLDLAACREELSTAQRRAGALSAVTESVRRLEESESRLVGLRREQEAAAEELTGVEAELVSVPRRREALLARLDPVRDIALQRDQRRQAVTQATHVARAAEQLGSARLALEEAERRSIERRARLNEVRSRHLDIVERRLAGMAAELAGSLREGAACVVCGSTRHPEPASARVDAVTAEEQEAAQRDVTTASADHDQAQQEVRAYEATVLPMEQIVGDLDLAGAQEVLATAETLWAEAEEAKVLERTLLEDLEALEESDRGLTHRAEQTRSRLDTLTTRAEEVVQSIEELRPHVRAVLGEQSLGEALDRTDARIAELSAGARALEDLRDAESHLRGCRLRAERAATQAGFESVRAAAVARVAEDEETSLEEHLAMRERTRIRAHEVVQDPEVRLLEQSQQPHDESSLEASRVATRDAVESHQAAHSAADRARERRAAIRQLDDRLDAALATWRPVREEHELVEAMSTLVRGTSADNQLQVRLSSYVLMTQLDLVLDAANERLRHMRDNRYTLHRALRGTRSRSRTGLDIEVMDEWTGQVRAPSTLSGGETFKASLALALGLADVITHESGGLDIDTLFIDEGFGMLDPETLDEVMDCIDDLRGGGRSVGVVSHVTELMARIGTQLHVEPSREGSQVRVTTTAAV